MRPSTRYADRPEPRAAYWRYQVALYRGDEQIDTGTIEEVADRRGVQKQTIYFYTTPTGQARAAARKDKRYGLVAVRLDLDEEDDELHP